MADLLHYRNCGIVTIRINSSEVNGPLGETRRSAEKSAANIQMYMYVPILYGFEPAEEI